MGYYQAGGLFSRFSFKKLGSWVGKTVVKPVAAVAAKAAPIVTAFNPALGAGLGSIGAIGGRIGSMLSPQAAPAGFPMEGTPPMAPIQTALSYQAAPPLHLTPGLQGFDRRRLGASLRRRAPRRRGRRRGTFAFMA